MQYMLMMYVETDGDAAGGREADPNEPAWAAYTRALIDAGVMRSGNALKRPYTATTVRLRAGERDVQDGPYADTKEQLGGYYIIDVDGLDQALAWAARSPAASQGAVEVRPVLST